MFTDISWFIQPRCVGRSLPSTLCLDPCKRGTKNDRFCSPTPAHHQAFPRLRYALLISTSTTRTKGRGQSGEVSLGVKYLLYYQPGAEPTGLQVQRKEVLLSNKKTAPGHAIRVCRYRSFDSGRDPKAIYSRDPLVGADEHRIGGCSAAAGVPVGCSAARPRCCCWALLG